MANLLPTKGNLIAAKRSRTMARTGYELMDRKRNILIRELMGMIDTAKELQGQIDAVFTEAYTALQAANIRLGICDRIYTMSNGVITGNFDARKTSQEELMRCMTSAVPLPKERAFA